MTQALEERVLVLAPSAKDADLSRTLLRQAGVTSHVCGDLLALCRELELGAAAVLLTEEWMNSPDVDCLLTFLRRQPNWSELPVLILARDGADSVRAAFAVERLGNVILLERPIRIPTLITAVQTALRSRRRQYQIREHLRERSESEAALRESEERLRFSLDAGRLGSWRHEFATGELIASDLCKQSFGRRSDETIFHREVVDAVHPEDRDEVLSAIRDAIRDGKPYDVEYRVIWPDGSVHWVMVRGQAEYAADGSPVRTQGITLDITERKNAEQRLGEQSERMRLLSESVGLLLGAEDPEKMVAELFDRVSAYLELDLYFNYMLDPAAGALRLASYYGIDEDLAERIAVLEIGQGLCGVVARTRRSLTLGNVQESDDPNAAVMRELGMTAYTCSPLIVGDRFLGTLSFATRNRDSFSPEDLSFLRTVCHYVAMAKERIRVEADLREAARQKDEFLAMLAHELRNPLAPMTNAVEVLRSHPGRDQETRSREVMERQLQHMSRLVGDLLDVSRINTGKVTLKKQRTELTAAVERVVEGMRGFVEGERNHELNTEYLDRSVWVDVDPVRLDQIVSNLLNNAAKYTDPGGRIQVSVEAGGETATIRVRDNGVGIASDLIGQVFEVFTQGERDLDRAQGGLGLGLTLVRSLTEMHGGEVEAHSDGLGKGSEFVVTLPVAAGPPPEVAAPQKAPRRPARAKVRGERLLVVDDNRDAAETLADLASLWGYEVETAFDGLAAVECAQRFKPSVVVLDIGMPGLNGYEVARRMRSEPALQDTLLIALTGYGQEEDRRRSLQSGFDYHLVKPADLPELEAILKRMAPAPVNA